MTVYFFMFRTPELSTFDFDDSYCYSEAGVYRVVPLQFGPVVESVFFLKRFCYYLVTIAY